ncbi:hypothetical lipoprotein [Metamycoplasma arthritidis]|uniref:Hypothetical lipoprotein n=1 Tax=Metamycoplasma arthritidis (strain 158L3-1) TaxID=243272 RepID=B3PLY1_META1|nr:leucine-rich repeat domain-containing protein [Metamycoplasma arthritidis]ACF07033.1 hypothetical lipoprotein [Metamycoplasma arthritidis 158L3-1]VEU78561.1 hypothetical lipoprotein [Metamycoplasma arthritidis]
MKKIKNKLLLGAALFSVPIGLAATTYSCACQGEQANSFAADFFRKEANLYNKATKTLDLSKLHLTHIPAGSFSKLAISGIIAGAKKSNGAFKTDLEKIADLEKIILPSSLEYIGKGAFESLGIKEVTFAAASQPLVIDERAFYDNMLTSLTLPKNTTNLKKQAFAANRISNISLNDELKEIADGALSDNSLSSIDLKKVTTLGHGALAGNKFNAITLPATLSKAPIDFIDDLIDPEKANKVSVTVLNETLKKELIEKLKADPKHNITIN